MNINIDPQALFNLQIEAQQVMQMCYTQKECKDCPMIEKGYIQMQNSTISCDSPNNIHKTA